jgi:hypothetical protein
MGWKDRIKGAAYTSPSGRRLSFDFEDLSKTYTKRGTVFDFADLDGSLVQAKGISGRRYPIRCWFHGPDCDVEADGFEALLDENGVGRLEHPLYPTVDVAPFGEITRTDNLTSGYNQVSIDVTFFVTLGVVYPTGELDLGASVSGSVDAFNAASAAQFNRQLNVAGAADTNTFKERFQALLGTAEESLRKIAETTEDVNKQFTDTVDSINRGIDVLVGTPLTLAFQMKTAIQAPGRALSAIKDRLEAYKNLAADIFGLEGAGGREDADLFLTRELFAATHVSGSIVSVINTEFNTRTEALEAAEDVLTQFRDLAAWRDDNWDTITGNSVRELPLESDLDTGEAYQELIDATALAAGFLVQISFTLKQERAITTTSERTIIDLAAELYGADFESELDFFIDSNNFSGSEILEIPRGRRVVYYV